MNPITHFLQERLYPTAFDRIPRLFSEHAFVKVGADWHSQTYLSGKKHAHRTDKTIISGAKPDYILEQGGPAMSLVDYVMQRDRCSFMAAVRHLAERCGLLGELQQLVGAKESAKPFMNALEPKNTPMNNSVHMCTDTDTLPDESQYFYHDAQIWSLYSDLSGNTLVQYLSTLPGWNRSIALQAAKRYRIGTAKKPPFRGAPIFWRFSVDGKLCPSKIMLFSASGDRIKSKKAFSRTAYKNAFRPKQNPPHFYGLHLLQEQPQAPVALVESEKTAIIASLYFPTYVWIASGGASYFSANSSQASKIRMQPLKDRSIIVFPDLDKGHEWKQKARFWADQGYQMHVNNFVEAHKELAGKETADLADILVQLPLKKYGNMP